MEALGVRGEGRGFDLLEGVLEDGWFASDYYYVGTLGSQKAGDAEAQSLGASGDEDCL